MTPDHAFVGGYEIDPTQPAVCQICKQHHDALTFACRHCHRLVSLVDSDEGLPPREWQVCGECERAQREEQMARARSMQRDGEDRC